jgi:hypothetical protein
MLKHLSAVLKKEIERKQENHFIESQRGALNKYFSARILILSSIILHLEMCEEVFCEALKHNCR